MTDKVAGWYTAKVEARAQLGEALEAKGAEWLMSKQLTLSDARVLKTAGQDAKAADRDQKAQLAAAKAERKGRSVDASEVGQREGVLAATLPAVIADLAEAEQLEQARWLAALSFARFRIRVTSVPLVDGSATNEETKKVERVERSDIATRADGLAALCAALRAPGREPIQAALTARGLDAAALEALEADATEVARQGRNGTVAVEATQRESAAVQVQRAKWSAIRRLVRLAVQGDKELEALYARC